MEKRTKLVDEGHSTVWTFYCDFSKGINVALHRRLLAKCWGLEIGAK